MKRLHFVYSKGIQLKTPERLTYEVARRLSRHYDVRVYDQWDPETIFPEPGDILLGHPSRYFGDALFNRSFRQPGWGKRIVFCPFSHAMPLDAAAIDPLVDEADHMLALCGPYWFDTVEASHFSHWRYKMMRCDLGISLSDYPKAKPTFNPAGKRRFVYIGNAGPMKGADYFCRLAEANRDIEFHWIGSTGDAMVPPGTLRRDYRRIKQRLLRGPVISHGWADWRSRKARALISGFDFLLTCGRSDSNPTTILEATALGLFPVATQQCGYLGGEWLQILPLDDVERASAILHKLNACAEALLLERHAAGMRMLRDVYTWDRVVDQILACIEAPIPIPPADASWKRTKARNQARLRKIVRHYRRAQTVENALDHAKHVGRSLSKLISARIVVRPTGR